MTLEVKYAANYNRAPDIVGLITPNLQKSPKKTYAILQFWAEIISEPISANVPISPKIPNIFFVETSTTNYFVGVTNDVIFKILFPK